MMANGALHSCLTCLLVPFRTLAQTRRNPGSRALGTVPPQTGSLPNDVNNRGAVYGLSYRPRARALRPSGKSIPCASLLSGDALRESKVHGSYQNRADGRVAHRRGASPRQDAIREEGGGAQFRHAPSPLRCPPGSRSRRATCTPATRTTRRPAAGRLHRPRPRIWPRGRRCRASRGGSA